MKKNCKFMTCDDERDMKKYMKLIKELRCTRCGEKLTPYKKDPKTKKVNPHSWQCLKCAPNLVLSVG